MAIPDPATTNWVPIWNPNQTIPYYEVGNWVPVLAAEDGSGSQVFFEQVGRYTRIGDVVHCQFQITITSATWNISQNLQLRGYPFICNSVESGSGVISYYLQSRAIYDMKLYIPNGTAISIFHLHNSFSGYIEIISLAGDMPTGGRFIGSVMYKVQ